jgi:hypothetical protein
MTAQTQALLVAIGLIAPILIAILASPKALKLFGAWMIARAVALEDARMHYRITREAEHAILSQQYAIGRRRTNNESEDAWKRLKA